MAKTRDEYLRELIGDLVLRNAALAAEIARRDEEIEQLRLEVAGLTVNHVYAPV